jgi:hypothetical protein
VSAGFDPPEVTRSGLQLRLLVFAFSASWETTWIHQLFLSRQGLNSTWQFSAEEKRAKSA